MKECRKCHEQKPLDGFKPTKQNKDGRSGTCRDCDNAAYREWYQRNRYKKLASTNRYKAIKLGYKGGAMVYPADGDLPPNNGRCQICDETSDRLLHLDHDHETGVIRGWLCQKCNRGLGLFQDSPERLKQALTYLEAANKSLS